jgi:hypothetical protein
VRQPKDKKFSRSLETESRPARIPNHRSSGGLNSQASGGISGESSLSKQSRFGSTIHIYQPLTHNQARTEAFRRGIEKKHFSPDGTEAYGTFTALLLSERVSDVN